MKVINFYEYQTINEEYFKNKDDFNLLFDSINELYKENAKLDVEIDKFVELGWKKGQKTIQFKNYVGVIEINSELQINILPKIYKIEDQNNQEEKVEKARNIFLKMLSSFLNYKFLEYKNTNLNIYKFNSIYDSFIYFYLNNVLSLTKKGLKHNYLNFVDNKPYLKGKLYLSKHINKNFIDKSKFYIKFDEFTINTPENRIIKSVLYKLKNITSNYENQKLINHLLNIFDSSPKSLNYELDFKKIIFNNTNKHYRETIEWSMIFLRNNWFANFFGFKNIKALLFKMENIFESYIANLLERYVKQTDPYRYFISIQDEKYELFNKLKLRPDIVLEDKLQNITYIIDTKWKVLDDKENISNSDIYQMYAYSKKYNAKKAILFYPSFHDKNNLNKLFEDDDDKSCLQTFFADLSKVIDSEEDIFKAFFKQI